MRVFDTHSDTISKILDTNESLLKNTADIDINRMMAYESYAQFFAAFIDIKYHPIAYQRCKDIIQKFNEEIEKNKDTISFCRTYADLQKSSMDNKVGAFLSIEGGECIRTMNDLEEFYELGVRCIALTWNKSNHIASGVGDNSPTYGLTEFGRDMVRYMNELGIIIDVSHLHESAFWDIARISSKPIIATHSNAKTICNHRRNLSDDQLCAIFEMGGVVGMNFYPLFLNDTRYATLEDIVSHAQHMMELGGEKQIGFGADLDGVDSLPIGFQSCMDYECIRNEFLKHNFGENVISDIEYNNFNRFLRNFA